jgi:hypothetical protein
MQEVLVETVRKQQDNQNFEGGETHESGQSGNSRLESDISELLRGVVDDNAPRHAGDWTNVESMRLAQVTPAEWSSSQGCGD